GPRAPRRLPARRRAARRALHEPRGRSWTVRLRNESLEPLAGLEEARADGADGALHRAGDVGVLHPVDVEEHEGGPKLLGQVLHAVEDLAHLAVDRTGLGGREAVALVADRRHPPLPKSAQEQRELVA